MKKRKQRAIITFKDTEDGFTSQVSFEPSIRHSKVNSPAANAAVRLSVLINNLGVELGKPLDERIETANIIITDSA